MYTLWSPDDPETDTCVTPDSNNWTLDIIPGTDISSSTLPERPNMSFNLVHNGQLYQIRQTDPEEQVILAHLCQLT